METGIFPLKWIGAEGLNAKQKEIYNFQKIAAVLADYGFNCIKLQDDWLGADFLAYHKDGDPTLKVQLKSRVTIDEKYRGKDLHIAFPFGEGVWYLVPHDALVEHIGKHTKWLDTLSWKRGHYSSTSLNPQLRDALKDYALVERG